MTYKTQKDDLWEQQIRSDGRAVNELRQIRCELGVFHPQANGSSSYSIGNTKVFAAVYGPHEITKKKNRTTDKTVINCEYSSACFSSNERKTSTKSDRKSIEVSKNLQCLVEHLIVQDTFPGSQVDVYIEVIQDDGGAYAACINAMTLALVDAGLPIRDYLIATTATITQDIKMLDLNSQERGNHPELTIGVLSKNKEVVVLEQSSLLPLVYLPEVIQFGIQGCDGVFQYIENAVRTKFVAMGT